MIRKPTRSSAVLGVAALTLAGLVIGRVDANTNRTPADFTPVVITPIANHDPTPKPTQKPTQTAAPKPDNTTRTFLQITPTPRDISDDTDGSDGDDTSDDTGDSGSADTGDDSNGSDDTSDSGSADND